MCFERREVPRWQSEPNDGSVAGEEIDVKLRDLSVLEVARVYRRGLEMTIGVGEARAGAHGFGRACGIEFGDLPTEVLVPGS